jgi:hypothetical protein
MTIDEAIRILEDNVKDADWEGAVSSSAAFKLGIEALKSVQRSRQPGFREVRPLLPGETEE